MNQVERRLREIAKRDAGKGVILRHLNMANRCGFDSGVKTVFLNTVIKTTSKLIQSDQWPQLDEGAIMKIYNQEFLAATEGELYLGAKNWCLRNISSESEALKMFLVKFVQRIILEYMSQIDFSGQALGREIKESSLLCTRCKQVLMLLRISNLKLSHPLLTS